MDPGSRAHLSETMAPWRLGIFPLVLGNFVHVLNRVQAKLRNSPHARLGVAGSMIWDVELLAPNGALVFGSRPNSAHAMTLESLRYALASALLMSPTPQSDTLRFRSHGRCDSMVKKQPSSTSWRQAADLTFALRALML